jgi:murein peptide amidase A
MGKQLMKNRWNKDAIHAWLHRLETIARDRGFESTRWGESEGLPLLGLRRPARDPSSRTRIYLSAGIHGDEPAGPLAVEFLLHRDLLRPDVAWTLCPLLNPGGWLSGTRETASGIDLNRDYLQPKSPEATAHCAWIDQIGCHDLYLSLHEDWEATGFYLYEINTAPQSKPLARKILQQVATMIPIEPVDCIDQHTVCSPGYIAHPPEPDDPRQWPEAIYHCKRYPHLSYTFETPSSLPLEQRVNALVTATQTAAGEFRNISTEPKP